MAISFGEIEQGLSIDIAVGLDAVNFIQRLIVCGSIC